MSNLVQPRNHQQSLQSASFYTRYISRAAESISVRGKVYFRYLFSSRGIIVESHCLCFDGTKKSKPQTHLSYPITAC